MAPVNAAQQLIDAAEDLRLFYKKYCECETAEGKAECMAGVLKTKLELLTAEVRALKVLLDEKP